MSESALEIQKRLFGAMFAQSAETEPAPTTPESVQANVPQAKPTAELPTANDATEGVIDLEESVGVTTENDLINDIKLYADEGKSFEFILKELQETLQAYPARQPISDARLEELIQQHAPNLVDGGTKALPKANYPSELEPLIKSGAAFYTNYANGRPNHVMVKWCSVCHSFGKDECCGKSAIPKMADSDGDLTKAGRQSLGLEPIDPVKTAEQKETELIDSWKESSWWRTFSGVDELKGDGLKMYISNFLPEGVSIICGLPKEGKSWLALSIARALTTGQALFGRPEFTVPESVPVIYMAAESGDSAFKQRVMKLGITNDKTRFLCRTLSSIGDMNLGGQTFIDAIRAMKPVVILDVLSCFSQSDDEDDSVENQKLRRMIGELRKAGAKAIVILHHSTKNFKAKPTKENAVRGSGDILAMVDVVWALMMDERLTQSTNIEEVDVIGWGRDFSPSPFRFALTRKARPGESTYRDGVVSVLDIDHDLVFVDKAARKASAEMALRQTSDYLESLVRKNPAITLKELASRTGQTYSAVQADLKACGWSKPAGRSKKGEEHVWTRSPGQTVSEQSVTIN